MDKDTPKFDKPKNSLIWYLLPVFFGIFGGIIIFVILWKKNNHFMAKIGLVIGILMTLFPFVFTFGIITACQNEIISISQCDWFKI